jgi:uncharacterized protein HemX
MAAVRLSQLQKRIMSWLRADAQRTHGRMASSHQDLARALQHDKGNLSHSLRTLDVHFISSSPVELSYACMVEGDRKPVQNVGGEG